MHIIQIIVCLLLIPICSELNHLGGQSTTIPNPRIVCRVFGIGMAFAIISLLSGLPNEIVGYNWAICTAGMALWAVWKNGPEFMSINATDFRDYTTPWYTPNKWLTKICDDAMGVMQTSVLTPAECKEWGTLYGCLLGIFLYPLFLIFGFYLSPAAIIIGLVFFAQGMIYRDSCIVLYAEYWMGALIGSALAAVLIIHFV